MVLLRPPDTVLPEAAATISILPNQDHSKAKSANAIIKRAAHFGAAETGVSVSSKCAGKNASSSAVRLGGSNWSRTAQTLRHTVM